MCLYVTHLEPEIADKDIVCYKLVKRTKIKGIYKSSFQRFEYVISQLYTNNINYSFANKVIKKERIFISYMNYLEEDFIEEGMFHSYMTLSYSLQNSIQLLYNGVILKCIIPKGAYYFEGKFDETPSYASSQIKILEEI